jgi:hypothetical protein
MIRKLFLSALIIGLPGAAIAEQKPAPEGLECPIEIAGGERISVGAAALEPGVTGYCVYYLVGETDFDALTMTLRVADGSYDWQANFKTPKVAEGGMKLVDETVGPAPFGDGERSATMITLSRPEADLGPITESFSTLWVFELGNDGYVSLEEEYNNVSAPMRATLREALLRAQKG